MQIYIQNITSDKGSPKYKSSVLRSYSSPFEHSKTRNAAFPTTMTTQKLGASHDVSSKSKPIGHDGVRRSLSKTNSHPKVGESANNPSDNSELEKKGAEVAKTSNVAIEK